MNPPMKKNPISQSGRFNPRALLAFAFCSVGSLFAMLSFAATPSGVAKSKLPYSSTGNFTAASGSIVQLFAGGGVGDGAPAVSAILSQPMGLGRTTDGRLLIADQSGRVRSVSGSGLVSTLGGPAPGFFPVGVTQRSDGAIW